jgi:phospholipid N-methyltransferase
MIFYRQLLKSAKHTGAIAPSSPFLARKICSVADIPQAKTILELGPGTGAITKELLKYVNAPHNLFTVEINPEFITHLQKKYPQITHLNADIKSLGAICKKYAIPQADIIVSGIPFTDFNKEECNIMFREISEAMHSESKFILFTYSPIRFKAFFQWFEKISLHYVPLNLPPAYVLVLRKK